MLFSWWHLYKVEWLQLYSYLYSDIKIFMILVVKNGPFSRAAHELIQKVGSVTWKVLASISNKLLLGKNTKDLLQIIGMIQYLFCMPLQNSHLLLGRCNVWAV